MSQSVVNSSNVPLGPNNIFIGLWEGVLDYATISVQIKTNTNCEIKIYQTSDKVAISSEAIPYSGGQGVLTINRALSASFVYVSVRNTDSTAQDALSLNTIYKTQILETVPAKLDVKIWDGSIPAGGATIPLFNANGYHNVTFYGVCTTPQDITVQLSFDGINWYNSQSTYTVPITGQFGWSMLLPFKWFRVICPQNAANLTMYVSLC